MPRANPQRSHSSPLSGTLALFAAVTLSTALLAIPPLCRAQSSPPATPQDSSTAQPSTHPAPGFHQTRTHLRSIPKQPVTPAETVTAIQATAAPAPEDPHWPANDQPAPARIVWDSQGLRIEAANASLSDILSEVTTLTGAHVEGFNADARVYGQFGPGPARDVHDTPESFSAS